LAYFGGVKGMKKFKIETVKTFILCFAIGFCFTSFISTIGYDQFQEYYIPMGRNDTLITPVLINGYNVIAVSLIFYGLYYENIKLKKILILIIGILSVYISIHTAKRTVLLVAVIVLVMNIMLFSDFKKIISMSIIAVTVGVMFLLANTDTWAIFMRGKKDNMDVAQDVRFAIWKVYLSEMFSHPFSGDKIVNPYHIYAHNLFLDVYIQHGILTMIILILIYIYHFYKLYILFKKSKVVELKNKIFFLSISIGLFLNEMTEPAYDGFPYLMYIHFFIIGYVEYLSKLSLSNISDRTFCKI
jgi:hypothetical protein